MYHSQHDTFNWIKKFADKDFKYHLTIAKVSMMYMLRLADDPIIPFNPETYAAKFNNDIFRLEEDLKKEKTIQLGKGVHF